MTQSPNPVLALQAAIDIVGSQAKMSRLLGVTQPTVWRWLNVQGGMTHLNTAGENIVLKVEAATGISRHDLRPDIYPREPIPHPTTEAA